MKGFSGFVKILIVLAAVIGAFAFVISNWDWVFSKHVIGQVVAVERVTDPSMIVSSRLTEAQMYSYSILIQGEDGKLYASSSEDRQWQVVKKGYCVDALLYRYPPWHLDRANTFHNARVKDVRVCPGQTSLPDGPALPQPEPSPAPTPAGQ